jgi:hypothetical protein
MSHLRLDPQRTWTTKMIITNPFTGQVLNANPEGHNQYFNPDGPSKRSVRPTKILPRLKDYSEAGSNSDEAADWIGGWVLPSGELIDAPETHGASVLEAPTDFGIHKKLEDLRERAYKKGQYDRIERLSSAAVKRAVSTGHIRVGSALEESPVKSLAAIHAGQGVPVDRILELIRSKKIPRAKAYSIETPDYQGQASLEDLYGISSFKHLARKKQFGA